MEGFISLVFLVLTTISYLVVGGLASKGVTSKEGYLLGDRQFNIKSITLTLIATQLGAGMIFGTAAEAYNKGIMGMAYILGMAIGLIVLGLGVGARLRALNISTTAELFEIKYGSKKLRKFASLVSIFTMGGILAAQIVASRQLFSTLFDLNPLWLIGFWIAIIAYTTFGGIKAVIATDILQVFVIVVIFTGVLFYIIPISEIGSTLTLNWECSYDSLFSQGFFTTLIAPILFSVIEQDLAQRCFASKTKRVATISALLAALFLLLYSFVPILLGMYAKTSGIVFSSGQSPLVLLLQSKLSTLGITMVACALLAAICSTADSLLGAASTNLIADFFPTNEKFSLTLSRTITLLVGLFALIVAFNFDDVIGLIIKSYEISIAALFIPMVFAIYLRKLPLLAAEMSIAFGIATFIIFSLVSTPCSPTLMGLLASAIGFIIGFFIKENKW